MAAPLSWSSGAPPATNDPNELLRRIDANTTATLSWVRYGFIAVVILLAVIAFVG
jgi:hypothetical protein